MHFAQIIDVSEVVLNTEFNGNEIIMKKQKNEFNVVFSYLGI